ncbi:FAD-dependent monooxygenase [Rhodovarius crocodyli]|uniref:FAD-dependent monooxygenase n=1 Tax=Rhodovarius crocodyli TaxID=1979269 RepID=A0A437MLV3_9PROT|nr:NAD(P)/FAD-dependent oxidoreductase [Rhodovarius crocodyli]RVT98648.1 FAD-dependent monooxygenase [Rhodovarius crocodyli]
MTTTQRHAEIAGGGIGGLGLGMMLAADGWTVRVHERSPEIREVGAGLYIKNNSLRVLEQYGVVEELEPHGTWLKHRRVRNAEGRVINEHETVGHRRCLVTPRQALVDVLASRARAYGVEVVTGSHIAGIEAGGALIDAAGKRYAADLVVAADGARSRLRNALGIKGSFRELDTLIDRFLVDTRSFTQDDATTEHWSGRRRIGITPSGPNQSYVYVVMPRGDAPGARLPLDVASWNASHPFLKAEFDILSQAPSTQYPYALVKVDRWSEGKAAIVGDCAHGLPPTLGQGAGLTLMNSYALMRMVQGRADIPAALREWEKTVRFISDSTQRWAVRYDWFSRQWPSSLSLLKPLVVGAFQHSKYLTEKLRMADRGLDLTPIGFAA